jgi:hypothetical protein
MLSENENIGFAVVGLGAGVFYFFRGFRSLQRKRLIEGLPTSKIRSIAMGLVEVAGTAVGEPTVTAGFTLRKCFGARYRIDRWQSDRRGGHWVKVREEYEGVSFYVEDETGRVRVDAAGAELDQPCDFDYDTRDGITRFVSGLFGSGDDPKEAALAEATLPQRLKNFCQSRNISTGWLSGSRMRYREYRISPGDSIYVLGTAEYSPNVQDEHERVTIRKGSQHPWFFVSERSQREVLQTLGRQSWLYTFGGAALAVACLGWLLFRFGWL